MNDHTFWWSAASEAYLEDFYYIRFLSYIYNASIYYLFLYFIFFADISIQKNMIVAIKIIKTVNIKSSKDETTPTVL
jgi:hypothetical protein